MQHIVQEIPAEDLAAASRKAEEEWEAIQAGGWPFQSLCDTLCSYLVSPRWESRHGCAIALREVLRSHACAASVRAPLSAEPSGESLEAASTHQTLCVGVVLPIWRAGADSRISLSSSRTFTPRIHCLSCMLVQCSECPTDTRSADCRAGWLMPGGEGAPALSTVTAADAASAAQVNKAWLEDCSARLLCVLALDRFGDYVSDKVGCMLKFSTNLLCMISDID